MTYFKTIETIPFKGCKSTDPMSFKYYNKDQVVLGKKMRDWCKFSVCFWHTFRGVGTDPFGSATLPRPWSTLDDPSQNNALLVQECKERVDAAFEFFVKLGVDYYTFHDRDVAPELSTIEETNNLLNTVTDYMLEKQKQTGVKLLWGTANLFSHPRYVIYSNRFNSILNFIGMWCQYES